MVSSATAGSAVSATVTSVAHSHIVVPSVTVAFVLIAYFLVSALCVSLSTRHLHDACQTSTAVAPRNAGVFARAGAPCRAQVGSLPERLGRAVAIGAPLRPDKRGRRLVRLCPVPERSLASLKPIEGVARRLLHRRPQHRGSPVSQTNRDGSGTKTAMSRLEFAQTRPQRRRQKAALARRRVWRAARKAARREAHAERWAA